MNIFTPEAKAFFATLIQEARRRGYEYEGCTAVQAVAQDAVEWTGWAALEPGSADALDDDTKRFTVRSLLRWARATSPYTESVVREVVQAQGLSAFIPATHGDFKVSFAGVTLTLTLPLDDDGQPRRHALAGALSRAIEDATVTPVADQVAG